MAGTAYFAAVTALSPTASFHNTQTTGTTLIESVGGNGAFALSGTFTLNQPGPASDVPAILFGGGKASAASGGVTLGATGTIEAWVNITSLIAGDYASILTLNDTDGLYGVGRSGTDARPDMFVGGITDHFPGAGAANSFTLGAWHQVAVSITAGTMTFYLDGAVVGATATGWVSKVFNTMGNDPSADVLTGSIGPVNVFSAALTTLQINNLFTQMKAAASGGTSTPRPPGIGLSLGLGL